MAAIASAKPTKKAAAPRKTAARPTNQQLAAEAERLAAEKEASDDKAFGLSHRVATLEGRERDLNELITGHRERIAALEAERDALNRELEVEKQTASRLRERERDLQSRMEGIHGQIGRLEAQRDTLKRHLVEEQSKGSAKDAGLVAERDQFAKELKEERNEAAQQRGREAELQQKLASARDQIAGLETKRDELAMELKDERQGWAELHEKLARAREQIAGLEGKRDQLGDELARERQASAQLLERERDQQGRMSSIHEQVGRLQADRDAVKRTLDQQHNSHSAQQQEQSKRFAQLQEREAELQQQLASAGEQVGGLEARRDQLVKDLQTERQRSIQLQERELERQQTLEGIYEQIGRLEAQRDTLKRDLAEGEGNQAARERIAAVEAERDELAAELEAERERSAQLQELERERQQTMEAIDEQIARLEAQRDALKREHAEERDSLVAERDRVKAEKDRLQAEKDRLKAELDRLQAERNRLSLRLEGIQGSRTYRMMQLTWRFRAALKRPFQRSGRPALAKGEEASEEVRSPDADKKATKPAMPRPVMRARATKPSAQTAEGSVTALPPAEPETASEPDRARIEEPATEPEQTPEPAQEAASPAASIDVDVERDRWLAKTQSPPADVEQLRVAAVLDEMSATCFEPDCDLLRFDSEGWHQSLDAHEPHLLLVESTWQGNSGSWQYQVASYTHPDYIGLPNLKALIARCRERDIPTVFWNKEDPVHFERFKEAAELFDYILTSDANCIASYGELERTGTGAIDSLQFAAQPRVHNPIGAPEERSDSPVFAGAYYRDRHIDRQGDLEMLLDAALPFGLEIYDRRFGSDDKAFGFPERFADQVKGRLSYEEMVRAYKSHKIFLNVNSVMDSPTMFSRRVFELLACDTAVVSTKSIGVEKTLGDLVSIVKTPEEATEALTRLQDDDYRRQLVQRARRLVMSEHTYRHRLAQIAETVGFRVSAYSGEEVAALALVDDVDQARQLRDVVASISAQTTLPAELLVGSHTSVAGDLQELPDAGREIRVRVVQQDPEAGRGERYRELGALAVSPWVAILHPAHEYGEHHFTDLVLSTRFAGADVIGNASFETSTESETLDRSLEHRFVDSVHPHSALVRRELVARRGWPDEMSGVGDSLSHWFRDGVRFYSGDAGNFQADAALGLPGRAAPAAADRSQGG